MPKVSEEHRERRRGQILAAAQRCFARHGYEGATVARLEAETGLSRGAIFNYFPDKESLFLAVMEETSERLTEIWLERGYRALLEEIVDEDPDWLSVQLEAIRRYRTDPAFAERVAAQEAAERPKRAERLRRLGDLDLRDDVPVEQVAIFLSLVANGLALRLTTDDPLPDLDALAELVERGVAPRRARSTGARWKEGATRPGQSQRPSRRSAG